MRKFILGLAVILAGGLLFTACSGKPHASRAANPLIGSWKFSKADYVDGDGNTHCYTGMDFTATAQTMYIAGQQGTTQVLYKVVGNKVYVSSDPSFYDAPDYIIVDANTIEGDTSGECYYTRQ